MVRPEPSVPPSPPFWTGPRVALAAAFLLITQLVLAVTSLLTETPTIDEVIHLPAGISYWQTGTFKLYHHNPPLIKLIAALPALAMHPMTAPLYQTRAWSDNPPNKAALAHAFAELNAEHYFELFTRARILLPLFSVVGGLVVLAWSSRLYGRAAGLLSLALWTFCPNILAHTRLITTDVGATALGVLATWMFWRYLKEPSWRKATLTGLCLGLAELSKFSLVLFYVLWPLLGLIELVLSSQREDWGRRLRVRFVHGLWIVALSALVIDVGYGFEGVGTPLGRFEFTCQTLTRPIPPGMPRPQSWNILTTSAWKHRMNRFRGTWLENFPSPLPSEYWLGFDDQKFEAEGVPARYVDEDADPNEIKGYPVYLDRTLSEKSWWYYYTLAMVYKVPEGTLALVGLSLIVLITSPRSRASWFDELTVLSVPAIVWVAVSFFTNISIGLRYMLPVFPYLFISAGKVVPWASGLKARAFRLIASAGIIVCLLATVTASAAIYPHYLAYFNALSGGPIHGSDHLIDSSLDWGQDLVNLRHWLQRNAPGEKVGLAYFGQINPQIFDARPGESFPWFLPPAKPGTIENEPGRDRYGPRPTRLEPGLYAVSASLLRGLPWRVYSNDPQRKAPYSATYHAFDYFLELKPIAHIGYSIFVYRVTDADAARLAPLWNEAPTTPSTSTPPR